MSNIITAFAASCSDIPTLTIHRCAAYQSQLQMCESTNAVVHSIAVGDCKTYCLHCRGKFFFKFSLMHLLVYNFRIYKSIGGKWS